MLYYSKCYTEGCGPIAHAIQIRSHYIVLFFLFTGYIFYDVIAYATAQYRTSNNWTVILFNLLGGNDKNAVVFNKDTEQVIAVLKGHTKKVTSVIYHPTEVSLII